MGLRHQTFAHKLDAYDNFVWAWFEIEGIKVLQNFRSAHW
jgi:hypothetical protein